MTILDDIVEHKKNQVAKAKELYPVKLFEESEHFDAPCISFTNYLKRTDKVGIIAEIKRRSPSKGVFHESLSVEDLSIGYMQAGATGLSILTDKKFFGGVNEDLRTARRFNYCPLLRKDFIVDEYQIVEAKAIGADAILLIAAILSPEEIAKFAQQAHRLGLQVLLEVHTREEIASSPLAAVDMVGINNRDLKTFTVSLETSLSLAQHLPADCITVSESGISSPEAIVQLKQAGFNGFLIGESFMSTPDPAATCKKLIKAVNDLLE